MIPYSRRCPDQTFVLRVDNELLTILYGDVEFQISDGHQIIRWRTMVGFVDFGSPDDEVIVLGHGGCLDYFTARCGGELWGQANCGQGECGAGESRC